MGRNGRRKSEWEKVFNEAGTEFTHRHTKYRFLSVVNWKIGFSSSLYTYMHSLCLIVPQFLSLEAKNGALP